MTTQGDDMQGDDFSLWFALKSAVGTGDWPLVMQHLDETTTQNVVRHPLTIGVMQAAVGAGKPAIVQALIARGYVPEKDDLKKAIDLIEFTEPDDLERVSEALRHLTANIDAADLDEVVAGVWRSSGARALVAQMAAAGMDVLLDGAVIEIVTHSQNPDLMQLMFEQGASPFAPKTVAAIVARSEGGEDVKRAWWLAACAHRDYKTALVKFDAMCVTGGNWHAGAFLNPLSFDKAGAPVTLLGILAAQGKLDDVFQVAHWQDTPAQAVAVHDALAQYGLKDKVSLAPLAAAINRHTLAQRKNDSSRFKL